MARKATKKKARTVSGWAKRAPKTQAERRKLHSRCGAKAFLDPKNLKYPIMAKSGACAIDCQGLRAAKARAGQMAATAKRAGRSAAKFDKMKRKADKLGKSAACHWAP